MGAKVSGGVSCVQTGRRTGKREGKSAARFNHPTLLSPPLPEGPSNSQTKVQGRKLREPRPSMLLQS